MNAPNRKFVVYSQKSSAIPPHKSCPLHYQFIYAGIKQLYFEVFPCVTKPRKNYTCMFIILWFIMALLWISHCR